MKTPPAVAVHPAHATLVILVIAMCAFQSITKGWASFWLFPTGLFVLPLYAVLQRRVMKVPAPSRRIYPVAHLMTVSLLLWFVCTVGVGDTDAVWLFGFYESTSQTVVAQLAHILSMLGLVGTVVTFAYLFWLLRSARPSTRGR